MTRQAMKNTARLFAIAFAAIMFAGSCAEYVEEAEGTKTEETKASEVGVNLQYSTSESDWGADAHKLPVTRATLESSNVTRLSFSVFDSNGKVVESFQQAKDEEDFGTIPSFRLSPGTYSFVAVAYKASGNVEDSKATITSSTEASINEQTLYDTYGCVKEVTVESGKYTKTSVSMTLKLCVSRLVLTLIGTVPEKVEYIKIVVNPSGTASDVFALNPTTGCADDDCKFERSWHLTGSGQTNPSFTVTSGFKTSEKITNITISALDEGKNVLNTRTLENVTLTRAKILKVATNLFSQIAEINFDFEDWGTVNGGTIE